jgi:hypothetical protein
MARLGRRAALVAASAALILTVLPSPASRPASLPGLDRAGFPKVADAVFLDDASIADPAALWGSVDCQQPTRVRTISTAVRQVGADGVSSRGQGDVRRVRVLDGDDYYGERCELGRNDHRVSPVALFHEGDRWITYLSLRLARRFPLHRPRWQVAVQMKQTQPADAGGGRPILSLGAFDGRWRLRGADRPSGDIWSTPAHARRWTRIAFDVTYSANPEVGSVRVFVDRNGDGDALDRAERSRRVSMRTLKAEGPGDALDGLAPGDAIPSHLRVGIYHDPRYRCEGLRCSIEIAGVGVYYPGA